MRLHEYAAGGDAADHARELQGSGCDGALTGGHRNHLALIPLAVQRAFDPFRRGHQASFLARKVNPRFVSDAEVAAVISETVDSQTQAHVVEEHIAGLQDGFMKVRDAVGLWAFLGIVDPAVILPAKKVGVTRTKRRKALRRNVIFQHRRGGHGCKRAEIGYGRRVWRRHLPLLGGRLLKKAATHRHALAPCRPGLSRCPQS